METAKKVILTGDRPTGRLHLGHYVGSLKNRLALESQYRQFILIADAQALTDNFETPERVRESILEVMLDYLAVGIDPKKSTIFLQTAVPEIQELAFYLLNFATVSRLSRNPTVKTEIQQKGLEESLPVGFFVYPISQAADITSMQADIVPVGDDQNPMIELTNDIVDRFQRLYQSTAIKRCEAVVPKIGRLPGTDGKQKMGKSLGNAIYLSDPADVVKKKVQGMYTDPNHLRVEDPGTVEGNPTFTYLRAFDPDQEQVSEMEEHYRRGGLGDGVVKQRLNQVLQDFLEPIRVRRTILEADRAEVLRLLQEGTEAARNVAAKTLSDVKRAMGMGLW